MRTGRDGSDSAEAFIAAFHAGDRRTLEECYRMHFDRVYRSVGRVLTGADHETVVHDVFFKIISEPQVRQNFKGGDLGSWLATIARNQAIDLLRKRGREHLVTPEVATDLAGGTGGAVAEHKAELALFVERFCRKILPAKWLPVFEARFVKQLSQRDAARSLGMQRTTLAYQEMRIRALLRRHLRSEEIA